MEYNSKIEGKRQKKTSKKGQETNDRGQRQVLSTRDKWQGIEKKGKKFN